MCFHCLMPLRLPYEMAHYFRHFKQFPSENNFPKQLKHLQSVDILDTMNYEMENDSDSISELTTSNHKEFSVENSNEIHLEEIFTEDSNETNFEFMNSTLFLGNKYSGKQKNGKIMYEKIPMSILQNFQTLKKITLK